MPPGDRQAAGTQPPHRWGHAGPPPPTPTGHRAEPPAAAGPRPGGPPHRPAASRLPGHRGVLGGVRVALNTPTWGLWTPPSPVFCVHSCRSCPLRVHRRIWGTPEVPPPPSLHTRMMWHHGVSRSRGRPCTSLGPLWRCLSLAHSHSWGMAEVFLPCTRTSGGTTDVQLPCTSPLPAAVPFAPCPSHAPAPPLLPHMHPGPPAL